MIFCYTQRLVPSPIVIKEAPSSNCQKQMQTNSQTLDVQGILERRRIKDCRSQRVQGHHKKTHSINSPGPIGAHRQWQTVGLHGTDLGILHIYYSCVAWSSYGSPNSRNRAVSDSFTWDPIPHTGSPWPASVQVRCLVLLQLDMPCFVDIHRGPFLS